MTQHVRITLEQAKELHHSGVLNTTTLVLFFFKIKLAEDWVGKFANQDIYQALGISKASFYRAIAFLRVQGLLFWKTSGVTEYAFNPDILYGDDEPVRPSHSKACLNSESESLNTETGSLNDETPSLKVETEGLKDETGCLKDETRSLKDETESLNCETQCLKDEIPTPSEPSPDKDSSVPTNLFQIYFNSLSSSLKGLSEDETEINSFLEWWTAEMGNFPEPIRNPIAFLRSIDPNTGQERLVTQWLLWKQGQVQKKPRKRSYNDEWERIVGLSAQVSPHERTENLIADPRLLKATRDAGGLWKIGMTSNSTDLQKLKAAFVSSLKEQDGVFDE